MQINEFLKRGATCAVGILASAAGIAFLTKSGLGTSQISSLPYVASFIFPVTLGTATFVMNVAFVLAQFVFLRGSFEKRELMQIPLTFVFSVFIDLMMAVFHSLNPEFYALRLAFCLVGSAALALGISLQIVSNLAILPGDGIVRLISARTKMNFGTVKISFDLALVASALILSFAFLSRIVGLREGTLIAALLVGTIARLILLRLEPLGSWLAKKS
jgi:uncharacterized membrane protein YczE